MIFTLRWPSGINLLQVNYATGDKTRPESRILEKPSPEVEKNEVESLVATIYLWKVNTEKNISK